MKKEACFKVLLKSAGLFAFTLLIASAFISCENFLQGANTAKELDKLISYANAPASSVLLKADESQGTFIAGDSKEFKVGYETEIYFSANIEACILSDLTAQFATDSSKDISEYISIKILERDDEKGLYKISVKVLKEAPDIIIKPVCLAYPAVESYSPKSDAEPCYANMPVVITFTVPMEKKNVIPEKSVFNFSNISLSYNGQDVSEYFETPYFNEDKTVLTIVPKASFFDYVASTNEVFIEINVDFASDIAVKTDTRTLPFKQNEKAHFKVRYKADVEKEAPVKAGFGFFASTKKYELNDLNGMSLAEIEDLNNFTQEEIAIKGNYTLEEYSKKVLQNRTSKAVYIYGRYYDKDSGVNSVSVALQQTNEKTGLILRNQDKLEDLLTFDKAYPDSQVYKDNNIVLFRYKYELEGSDGAYSFKVKVYDACGNPSAEEAFTAIKDTELKLDDAKLFNLYSDSNNETSTPYARMWELTNSMNTSEFNYNETIKTIQLLYAKYVYGPVEASGLVKFFVKYVNKDQKEVTKELSRDSDNDRLYLHRLDVDHVHDLKITLIAEDEIGNSASRDYYFPPQPKRYADSNGIFHTPDIPATSCYYILYKSDGIYETGVELPVGNAVNTFLFTTPISQERTPSKAYFFYENGLLVSETNDDDIYEIYSELETGYPIYFEVDNTNKLPENLDLSTTSFKAGSTADGTSYTLTTTLPSNTWTLIGDKFDYLLLALTNSKLIFDVFEKGTTVKISEFSRFNLSTQEFYIAGLKNGKISPYSAKLEYEWNEEKQNAIDQVRLEKKAPFVNNFTTAGFFLTDMQEQGADKVILGGDKVNEYLQLLNSTGKIETFQVTLDNAWRYSFSSDYMGKSRDSLILDIDDGNIYVPVIDMHYGDNDIIMTLINKNGSNSRRITISISEAPIVFSKPQSLPLTTYNLQSDPTPYDIRTAGNFNLYLFGGYVFVSYLDNDGWKQINSSQIITDDAYDGEKTWQMTGEEGAYVYSLKDENAITLPQNKFIKVSSALGYGTQIGSLLFYNGEPSQGLLSDKIIDMDGFYFVSSNKPVYVYTIATMKSLSECSSWTADEWDLLRFKTNEQLLDFSANDNGNLRIYTPDTSWMPEGFCYVTIARFADGHAIVSKVREK